MEKAVLLSVKPKFCEKIFSGEKRFEYRKVLFSDRSIKTVVVYATAPVSKVVGRFIVTGILTDEPRQVWHDTSRYSGISKEYFFDYFEGKFAANAIIIGNPVLFGAFVDLKQVPGVCAPQNFRYISYTEREAMSVHSCTRILLPTIKDSNS